MLGGIFGRKAGRAIKRLKIAVLFGGCSPEYSVFLQSAAAVLQNMDSSKYEAVMVGISKMGDWYSYKKTAGLAGDLSCLQQGSPFRPERRSYALSMCKNTAHFERVNMRQPSCGLEVDIGF